MERIWYLRVGIVLNGWMTHLPDGKSLLLFLFPLIRKSDFLHLHRSDTSKRHHGHAANIFLLP